MTWGRHAHRPNQPTNKCTVKSWNMVGSLHIRAISDEVAKGDMDAHIKKVRNRVMMPTDMNDMPNPDDFSVDERDGEYEAVINVRIEMRVPIRAESKEDAEKQAHAEIERLWNSQGEELYADSIEDVELNRMWKKPPMYRVIRDGGIMQVSRLKPGDAPRDPDERGF